jgi:putative sporulation protein YyaC
MKTMPIHDMPLRVPYTDPTATTQLAARLSDFLEEVPPERRIAVVCVGTDRSTGDSLGPLAGSTLSKFHSSSFDLFGTLEKPVHARNLDETLEQIHDTIRDPYIIGIDSCLGKSASVGCIQVGEGPVRPGSGVYKELTPVGDIHISGVVNVGGLMEYLVLQSTRLHLVMSMADMIAYSIIRGISISSRGKQNPGKLMYS